jgi:hypothetical protein
VTRTGEARSAAAYRRAASGKARACALAAFVSISVSIVARPAAAQYVDFSWYEGGPDIYMPSEIESARASGMGRVTSVVRDGAIATWWNPAFLARSESHRLTYSTGDITYWRANESDYIRSITLSGPLPMGSRSIAVGAGFKRFNLEFQNQTPFGGGELFEVRQDAYVVSLAYPVAPWLAIGLAGEYVREDIAGELLDAASLGFGLAFERPITFRPAGDEGAASPDEDRSLVVTPLLGASFLHAGQDLGYPGDLDDLARQLRGGMGLDIALEPPPGTGAFDRRRLSQVELTTAVEVYFPAVTPEHISQKRAIVHMGAELVLFGMLSSRIGFIDIDQTQGIGPLRNRRDETFGFGVLLPPGLPVVARLDWASVPGLFEERSDRWSVEVGLP